MRHDCDCLLAFCLDREGRVTYISRAFCRAVEKDCADLLQTKDIWKLFYSSRRPTVAEILLTQDSEAFFRQYGTSVFLLSPERDGCSGIVEVDRKIGPESTLSVQASLLRDEEKNVTGVMEVVCPINFSPLLENSPLIKTIISNLPIAVSLVFRRRLHMVNEAYAQLMGFARPEDAVGIRPETLVYEPDRARFIEVNARNYEGLQKGSAFLWRYKVNGEIRYVEGRPKVFDWGAEKALLSIMSDVTERVRLEKNLLQEHAKMSAEIARLFKLVSSRHDIFIGGSPAMLEVMEQAIQSARTDSNIIIVGETGTGKTMLARIIHDTSDRKDGPFVIVNCAAIPESLFESEFFGHKKGAFTGALTDSIGYLGAADNGTLVLDEVGELSKGMQAKLLHALESKTYMPVGSRELRRANVRLICATNRNLLQMMQEGQLREDFYFRIEVVNLRLPPLRERREDIVPMTEEFFRKFNRIEAFHRLDGNTLEAMKEYDWPGNIRELQSVVLRYLSTGRMSFGFESQKESFGRMEEFSEEQKESMSAGALEAEFDSEGFLLDDGVSLNAALEKVRRHYFIRALEQCGGSKVKAARLLGMNLRTFHRYCSQMGLMRRLDLKE